MKLKVCAVCLKGETKDRWLYQKSNRDNKDTNYYHMNCLPKKDSSGK